MAKRIIIVRRNFRAFVRSWLASISHIFIYRAVPERLFIKFKFRRKLKYNLNLNNPVTFNEKIQWYKRYIKNKSLATLCADKYNVREYIKDKIGEQYLIPLIFYTDDPEKLNGRNISHYPCIIKPNHFSGGGIILKNKADADWEKIRNHFKALIKKNYYIYGKEWQYKNIESKILVEKLLLSNGAIPIDYKFHVFYGEVGFIQLDINRFQNHQRNLYYPNWELIDCKWCYPNTSEIKKPDSLNKMTALAEMIVGNFPYVRVDMYYVEGKIYFGEMTFHPESGFGPFSSYECDERFGKLFELPTL